MSKQYIFKTANRWQGSLAKDDHGNHVFLWEETAMINAAKQVKASRPNVSVIAWLDSSNIYTGPHILPARLLLFSFKILSGKFPSPRSAHKVTELYQHTPHLFPQNLYTPKTNICLSRMGVPSKHYLVPALLARWPRVADQPHIQPRRVRRTRPFARRRILGITCVVKLER